MNKSCFKYLYLLGIILLINVNPATAQDKILFKSSGGTIAFDSDAPLELISASSDQLKGILDLVSGEFAFTVSNNTIKGFNSPLQQEHFYENYIEVNKFPNSTFQGKIIEPIDPANRGVQNIRAKGMLSIHGVEQERIISSTLEIQGNKAMIRSTFTILLKDHDIAIPHIVSQKIAEVIQIEVAIDLVADSK